MIINKCLVTTRLLKKCFKTVSKTQTANIYNRSLIGNRDWVCFGRNGAACYYDDPMWPLPPIRFRENTNELLALREKEKGDWRKLSIEEKKTLYRASFCQTLVEVMAPTGEWKSHIGISLILISVSFWIFIVFKVFFFNKLPESFEECNRRQTLRKLIDLKYGHLTGISSKWDYEKDDWKK